jgi:hypothetical protein
LNRGLTPLVAAVPLVLGAGCFNPDLSSEIGCNNGECPGDLECVDGVCVADGDGPQDASQRPRLDADGPTDADTRPDTAIDSPDGALNESDANARITCNPLTHESCSDDKPRCAFIATTALEPYNGFFGCVPDEGDVGRGEACAYELPTGDNHYDNCVSGLICGDDSLCQSLCDRGQIDPKACEDEGTTAQCEAPTFIAPDVYPYGVCIGDSPI